MQTFSTRFTAWVFLAAVVMLWGGFMAPPFRPVIEDAADEVSAWYARQGAGYEMGTWYTMIAGLLNILVIYDAYSGPLAVRPPTQTR